MSFYIRQLKFTVLLMTLLEQSTASSLWPKSFSSTIVTSNGFDNHLTAFVKTPHTGQSDVYQRAMELLGSMQSAPSCNRLATSSLLTSCQSIEGPSSSAEIMMDDLKSVFATRLAICELRSAGAPIPPKCESFAPALDNHQSKAYDKSDKRYLSHCLQSLESRPQWWTSYSNNKQNAVVMCRAARVEIEKDDMIKILKSMVATSSDIEEALNLALRETNQRHAQQQGFMTAIESFQTRLLQDMEKSSREAESYFASFVKSMDFATQNLMSKVSSAIGSIGTDIGGLSEIVRKSSVDVMDLKKNISKVFQQALQGSSELATRQAQEWEKSQALASQLQNSLESTSRNEVNALIGAFGDIHDQLQVTNELMAMMRLRQDALDEKLVSLDTSFGTLQTKAQAFEALQIIQAETQTRLYQQLQNAIQITSERLASIDASAANVGSKLKDMSSMLSQLSGLGGIVVALIRWKWPCLAILILFMYDRRKAVFATSILLTLFLVLGSLPNIPPDMILTHHASGYQLRISVLIKISGILGVLGLGFVLAKTTRWKSISNTVGKLWSGAPSDFVFTSPKHQTWSI